MSVFEKALREVASRDIANGLDDRRLEKQHAIDTETFRSIIFEVVAPVAEQFCQDSRANGFFAHHSGPRVNNRVLLIPIASSELFVRKDHAPQSVKSDWFYHIPLNSCLFELNFVLIKATADQPASVNCEWYRDPAYLSRETAPGPKGGVGFSDYGGAFRCNSPSYLPRSEREPKQQSKMTLREAKALGRQFPDKAFTDFLAYAFKTAQAESLELPAPPPYVRQHKPGPIRAFFERLIGPG